MHLVLGFIIFLIIYGSLYPFKFSGQPPGIAETFHWLSQINLRTTQADIIANILLFFPYGFVARMTLNKEHSLLSSSLKYLFGGFLIALLLQYSQFYLPARVPSSGDALFNFLGIILGMFFSHLLMQYSRNNMVSARRTRISWSEISIPLLLAFIWIAWRWFPFIPMVSTDSIIAGLMPLIQEPELDFLVILRDGAGWLMFFYLCSQHPFQNLPRFRVLKFAVLILGVEVFITDNQLTVNDLLAALGAFALYSSLDYRAMRGMLIWCLVVGMALTWLDTSHSLDGTAVISWAPFVHLLKGNPWANSELILLKLYFIGALIYLIRAHRLGWGMATVICSAWLLLLIILERYLTSHIADMTDFYLVPVVGWALFQIDKQASDERTMAMQ